MKFSTKLALSAIFLSAFTFSYAAQHTVSIDPSRVAQYTDLQLAIDDAANGDTILVYGAPTAYGNVNIYKHLVLIGEGYNPNNGLTTSLSSMTISNFNSTLGASGSTIMGFNITSTVQLIAYFSGSTTANQILSNITFLRNNINYVNFGAGSTVDTFNNINFINCFLQTNVDFDSQSYQDTEDVTFSNCIFNGFHFGSYMTRTSGVVTNFQDLSNVKVFNSLFLAYETGLLSQVVGMVFEDNIFFGHEIRYSTADHDQITWNNNLFYLVDQAANLLPTELNVIGSDNAGSGNLIEVNPLFTTYPATPAAFSYAHDYTLQAGSPALTASVSGGEIGIYGGAYPFAVGANPPVPKITEVTIQDGTSSVPVGGTINFNFKAESGN